MGTHPIFESDFDCLTEVKMAATETIVLSEKKVYVAVMEFGDTTMVTVSDAGVFGPMFKVTKNQKGQNEPVITIDGVFGEGKDYLQVVARFLRLNCNTETDILASIILDRELVNRENLQLLADTVNTL